METLKKTDVLNPLTLRNTVGKELYDIFEARGCDNCEEKLGVKNLQAKEVLSEKVINKASDILEIPELKEYLVSFQNDYAKEKLACSENYKQSKKTFTKLKSILPLLRGEFTDGYDVLDDIMDFFGVDSELEIFEESNKQAALFRKQNNVNVDPINLYAWLRRGEIDFKALELPDYDENKVMEWVKSRTWEKHIDDSEYFKKLPDTFAEFGVGLILVPSLPKTVYGAIRWIEGKPLIQISDRGRDLASCWFTLFHELGHAILHKNVAIYEGSINETNAKQSKREREANKFANGYLFNGDYLRKAVFERKRKNEYMSANQLAKEFDVAPLFVAYWLLKAQYNPAFQIRRQIDFTSSYQ